MKSETCYAADGAICFSQGREGRLITNPYLVEIVDMHIAILGELAGEEGTGLTSAMGGIAPGLRGVLLIRK